LAESDWTFETLRDYLCLKITKLEELVDERFAGSDKLHERMSAETDKRYQQRFDAQQESGRRAMEAANAALVEAKNASIVGFEKANEWRASLNDVVSTRIARTEVLSHIETITDKLSTLSARVDKQEGRSGGMGASWRDVISIIAALAAFGAVLIVLLHKG